MSEVKNVTYGKPRIAGACFVAPVGTHLPTTATEALDAAFKDLGFVSEDGVKNAQSFDVTKVKEWGGTTVLNLQTSFDDNFSVTLIESLNVYVNKAVYGDTAVTGDLESGMAVAVSGAAKEDHAWVFDMIMRNNILKRVVIPQASITEIAEIAYTASDAVGYGLTLGATNDEDGNSHYEYTQAPAEPTPANGVTITNKVTQMTVNDDLTLQATTVPADAVITWDTSDDTVVSVDSDGKISALAAGEATITATITVSDVEYTDEFTITVSAGK